jgi:hypothetical protein
MEKGGNHLNNYGTTENTEKNGSAALCPLRLAFGELILLERRKYEGRFEEN